MVWTAGRCLRRTHVRLMHLSNQWCLRMLLGIRWYQFVRNDDVRRLMKQPKLTAIIQSRRLTLFGHIMRMDDNADAKRILLASPPADWRRQLSRPRITWLSTIQQDLKHHHLTLPEAADLAQNCPLWSVEDDVDVWRYTIVSCMLETTTILGTWILLNANVQVSLHLQYILSDACCFSETVCNDNQIKGASCDSNRWYAEARDSMLCTRPNTTKFTLHLAYCNGKAVCTAFNHWLVV